jgi:hypothetical protein
MRRRRSSTYTWWPGSALGRIYAKCCASHVHGVSSRDVTGGNALDAGRREGLRRFHGQAPDASSQARCNEDSLSPVRERTCRFGEWKPDEIGESFVPREWDLTPYLTKAVTCEVTFQYSSGKHRLDISKAELLENGSLVPPISTMVQPGGTTAATGIGFRPMSFTRIRSTRSAPRCVPTAERIQPVKSY